MSCAGVSVIGAFELMTGMISVACVSCVFLSSSWAGGASASLCVTTCCSWCDAFRSPAGMVNDTGNLHGDNLTVEFCDGDILTVDFCAGGGDKEWMFSDDVNEDGVLLCLSLTGVNFPGFCHVPE